MNKSKIRLLSMLVISTVFCISILFSVNLPLQAITARDKDQITEEDKITEESSEEAISSLFAYNIDTGDFDDSSLFNKDENTSQSNDDTEETSSVQTLRTESAALSSNATDEQAHDESINDKSDNANQQYTEAYEHVSELKNEDAANSDASETNKEDLNKSDSDKDDTADTDTSEEKEKAAESKYSNIGISIAKDYVNIRRKPSAESESLGKLYRNSACTIKEKKDDWYYVESGSVTGYVKAEYIRTGIPDEELIQKYGTQKIRVSVDGLNVRKKPSTESNRLTVIYMNEKYPVIDKVDDWYKIKVEDENIEGYVKSEHVELIVTFKEAISKQEEERLQELKAEEKVKKEAVIKRRENCDYTEDDLKLLACLVHAEAGTQNYEGKLAVANVVINRVKSSKYPNTIKGVIYQKGQFSVARSGSLQKQLDNYSNYKSTSQKLSIKAAKAALEGVNNIGSRLYFQSYKAAARKGYTSKKNCVKIDDHLFW